MIKITANLPDEFVASLDQIVRREGRWRSAIVRDALDRYLSDQTRPLPAWIGMIENDDGTLTARNTEEWLRENWHPD